MGRVFGVIALLLAAVAIFIPYQGLTVSAVAVAVAIVAALCGAYGFAGAAAILAGLNAFPLSPSLWLVPWPFWIVGWLVAAIPFAAMVLHARFDPPLRIAIVASVIWAIGVPMAMQITEDHQSMELFSRTYAACMNEDAGRSGPPAPKPCYDRARQQTDSLARYTALELASAAILPVALGWLAAYGLQRRRLRLAQDADEGQSPPRA